MWTHRERADLRDKGTILKPFKEHLRPYCRRRTRATLRTCFAATVKSRYFAEPVQPLRQNVICDNPRSLWRVRGASFLACCNFAKLVNRRKSGYARTLHASFNGLQWRSPTFIKAIQMLLWIGCKCLSPIFRVVRFNFTSSSTRDRLCSKPTY